eukprot:GHVN01102950.1.p1 GENE.GHVN01102950.1~~GHVN01102950.1.p1  ORF type:complete len:792 (-),score=62.84 GHVN01102950.1:2932-5307(-)
MGHERERRPLAGAWLFEAAHAKGLLKRINVYCMDSRLKKIWTADEYNLVQCLFEMDALDVKRYPRSVKRTGRRTLFKEEQGASPRSLLFGALEESKDPLGQRQEDFASLVSREKETMNRRKKSLIFSNEMFSAEYFLAQVYSTCKYAELEKGREYLLQEIELKKDTLRRIIQANPVVFFMARDRVEQAYSQINDYGLIGDAKATDRVKKAVEILFKETRKIYGGLISEKEREEQIRKRLEAYERHRCLFGFARDVQNVSLQTVRSCVDAYRESVLLVERDSSECLRKVLRRNRQLLPALCKKIVVFMMEKNSLEEAEVLLGMLRVLECTEEEFYEFISFMENDIRKNAALFVMDFSADISMDEYAFILKQEQSGEMDAFFRGEKVPCFFKEKRKLFQGIIRKIKGVNIAAEVIFSFMEGVFVEEDHEKALSQKQEREERRLRWLGIIDECVMGTFESSRIKLPCFVSGLLFLEVIDAIQETAYLIKGGGRESVFCDGLERLGGKFANVYLQKIWEVAARDLCMFLRFESGMFFVSQDRTGEILGGIDLLIRSVLKQARRIYEAEYEKGDLFFNGMMLFLGEAAELLVATAWPCGEGQCESLVCPGECVEVLRQDYIPLYFEGLSINAEICETARSAAIEFLENKERVWILAAAQKKNCIIKEILFSGIRRSNIDWKSEFPCAEPSGYILDVLSMLLIKAGRDECTFSRRLLSETAQQAVKQMNEYYRRQDVYGVGGYIQAMADISRFRLAMERAGCEKPLSLLTDTEKEIRERCVGLKEEATAQDGILEKP